MSTWITEAQFAKRVRFNLRPKWKCDFVTGPGRSGAVAAVYASYALGIPFVPWDAPCDGQSVLIVDTASMSGKTIRKAHAKYSKRYPVVETWVAYDETEQRHHFWYERLGER